VVVVVVLPAVVAAVVDVGVGARGVDPAHAPSARQTTAIQTVCRMVTEGSRTCGGRDSPSSPTGAGDR
jgi:hypothetical protein